MITIKRGLDVPIAGAPDQKTDTFIPARVALVGHDYIGMKPTMMVQQGDTVKKGQPLFEDKKRPGVIFTAPVAGKVVEINRGYQRFFESIVITVDNNGDEVVFDKYDANQLGALERQSVVDLLVQSGQWTALRTRPFSRTPPIASTPAALFVNAMDTNPLAPDPLVFIQDNQTDFDYGLTVLSKLAAKTYVCHAPKANLPKNSTGDNISYHAFAGVHPAGLAGTHIHFLEPVSANKTVWTVGYQDVIAIGKLFTTGKIDTTRLISLAGPQVKRPRYIKTQMGADLSHLVRSEIEGEDNRVISGSVLSGRKTDRATGYLGRFHNQVSVLAEGHERPFMHYLSVGSNRFSRLPMYISQFFGNKKYNMTTTTNGSPRAMVPIGLYEKIMPLDILPTQLLKAIIVEDIESAIGLGVLELDEEDLALCTFVSPGKYEYSDILRDTLTRIEKEG